MGETLKQWAVSVYTECGNAPRKSKPAKIHFVSLARADELVPSLIRRF